MSALQRRRDRVTLEAWGEVLPQTSVATGVATWFGDPRSPARRLRASWHPENGLVVLSIWDHERCAATFRLPIEHVPAFMHLLVDALADTSMPQLPIVESRCGRIVDRLRRRFGRRSVASVVPLRRSE
jgi:hypothetical protein